MGHNESDSLWGTRPNARSISVDAFWMTIPKSPIRNTNNPFTGYATRLSVNDWPTRLTAVNETFKIEEDRMGNPVTPHLNWAKAIPWRNPTEDEARAIESVYRIDPISGKKVLDVTQLNYRYARV